MKKGNSRLDCAPVLQDIKAGKDRVFKFLEEFLGPKVTGFILNNYGGEADARIFLNRSLSDLWEKVKAGKKDCSDFTNLEGYIMQSVKYKWLNELEKRGLYTPKSKRQSEDAEAPQENPKKIVKLDSLAAEPSEHVLEKWIEELDDSKRKIWEEAERALQQVGDACEKLIRSFYLQGMSHDEIMKEMNFKTARVSSTRLYKCMEKVRGHFKKRAG